MDIFTHLVVGALIYNLFLNKVTFDYLIYALFFAILPDLDIFLFPLRKKFKSNYLEHRSGSHSFVIGVILSSIIGAVYSFITNQSFYILLIIGIIFYSVHISLDLLNTTKIPCFYPLSKKEYCFYIEKAGSSFTLLTSLIFLISLLLINNFLPNTTFFALVINLYTFFTFAYYLYRIFTKIWINSHLRENQKYFPGVLPFYYVLFNKEIKDNKLSFCIEKKSHISGSKLIYKNEEILTPQEMDFFNDAMELCLKNYYFSKWTSLPVFLRNDGIFSARFYFLEPMVHSRAMYMQYDFDRKTAELIGQNQSFDRIKSTPKNNILS